MVTETTSDAIEQGPLAKVLIVDDDALTRVLYNGVLSRQFSLLSASSGEEAIDACKMALPDLVLLDVEMPGMNGYETCRKLREFTSIPIVFATAHQTMEEQLKAFDAGGDDLITKPIIPEILLRKIRLAIQHKHAQEKLAEEKDSLQSMAMNFLSSMGESGVLLNFVRASLVCRSFEELAQNLVNAMREFGLEGSIAIRHGGGNVFLTTHGEPTPLEVSILEQASTMGRIFQFKRNLAVNYDKISIVVSSMPSTDDERSGRIRDNVAILAETAEAFCENVDMRKESMTRAESMQVALFGATNAVEKIRDKQSQMLLDVRLLLHELTDKIEKSYSWLGTSNEQERAISAAMNDSVQRIIDVLAIGNQMNEQFAEVVSVLRGNEQQGKVDLW